MKGEKNRSKNTETDCPKKINNFRLIKYQMPFKSEQSKSQRNFLEQQTNLNNLVKLLVEEEEDLEL